MKKVIILSAILISSTILSSCAPIVQGAAAVTTVATMSNDRRSLGELLDDKAIYMSIGQTIIKDSKFDDAHINFNVYDKSILLTGEVPNEEIKNYLEEQIQQIDQNILQMSNEVEVMPNSSYFSRTKDSIATLQVEALFLDQEVFHPAHISLLTERGIIYLMGSVTKREAEHASNIASKAKNVKGVVKLFNYLVTRPDKEIEKANAKKIKSEKIAELEAKKAEIEAMEKELDQQLFELSTN